MRSKSYEFIARGKLTAERPRLLSSWTLAGFAVVVLLALALTFPKQELLRQAAREKLGDPLTANYLANLLKTDPANLELRLLLAEHNIYLGELGSIHAILEPALRSADPDWQAKGRLIEYKYLTAQAALSKEGSSQRALLLERRRAVLEALAGHSWPTQTLMYLAGQAVEMHERAIVARIYRSLAESPQQMPLEWYADTAALVLGEGDYELAAQLFFIARDKADSLPRQRDFLISGVKALIANSLYSQALDEADRHLGNLGDDPDTLYFLARTARAANDPVRADRYARKMLHLSLLERLADWFQGLDLSPIGTANAAPVEQPQVAPAGMRSYDPQRYQLAYDIFLANRNLADAFRVAEAAVRQVPEDAVWHKRLAQVAEWNGKPDVALREWRWLALHGGGEESLLAVLRLAPGLGDYDALLEAWKRISSARQLDEAQWHAFADLFEQAGRPQEGIRFFEDRYALEHAPLLLEMAARLAQRSGDDDHAHRLYLRLLERHGFSADRLLKIVTLDLLKGRYQQAYDLLQKYRGNIGEQESVYWKLLADLAWQLQHDEAAADAYRRLASSGDLAKEDFSRLIFLLGESRQEEAAALAELAYRKYGDREMLLRALEIHAARHDLPAQKRLFEHAAADREADFSDSARFYLMRAQYHRAVGATPAARADFRRAASIAPNDANTVNAMLWFLIDVHDHAALREVMAQIIARGDHQNPAYWGGLAAAYQVLDQPARAVAYYTRQLKESGQDFLWLVNYADALEQDQQAGMAWRVRQHAWLQLRRNPPGATVALPFSPDMLAAARLAMLAYPHDPSLALVRSVLRQDRLVKRDPAADRLTNELVLGWAISNEQFSNARAWLWRRYSLTLSRPLWGDAMAAVAENDTERLDRLIAEQADGMPIYNRNDAARAVDQIRYAQSIVFDGLTVNPDNDEIHHRLSGDSLATASHINLEMRREQFGSLHGIVQSTLVEAPIVPNLRLAVELGQTRQASGDPAVLANVPATERIAGAALKIHGSLGDTEIALRRRREFGDTTELRLAHTMELIPGLNLQFGLEHNAAATESNPLRVFGMRDQIDATLHYAFSKREYLRLLPRMAHYYTQNGDFLGSGNHLSWELGHHIRTEYPDWTVRLTGIHTRFKRDASLDLQKNAALVPPQLLDDLRAQCLQDAVLPAATCNQITSEVLGQMPASQVSDLRNTYPELYNQVYDGTTGALLPDNANVYGLCFGFGGAYQRAYTQAWRPYFDYCATDSNLGGRGYNAMFGMAGSVAGHDHFSVTFSQGLGGTNFVNGLTRELTMRYRYYFDRY